MATQCKNKRSMIIFFFGIPVNTHSIKHLIFFSKEKIDWCLNHVITYAEIKKVLC